MVKLISLLVLFACNVFASADLGKELPLSQDPQSGNYQLGVHYFYDSGLVGHKFQIGWGMFFESSLSQQEIAALPEQMKWNAYDSVTSSYLANWTDQPVFSGKDLFTSDLSVRGNFAKLIIGNQKNVVLVFANLSGKALYHLDVGRLCKGSPSYFLNLTETSKQCDQVTVAEIDAANKRFCSEKPSACQPVTLE